MSPRTARITANAAPNKATPVTTTATSVVCNRTVALRRHQLAIVHHPVPDAAHGQERALRERLVDLAPQVTDIDLDHIGVTVEVEAPDRVQQLGLRNHLAAPPEEVLEHRRLTRCERDRRGAAPARAVG